MDRLLLLTSPELHGGDVAAIQRQLLAHRVDPGPVDGIYGPTTAAAVRRFQRANQLQIDGIVGPRTRAALAAPVKPAPPTVPSHRQQHPTPGRQALAWMLERAGMGETPPGSNRNPITSEFGLGPVAWCAETVSLAFKHGAGIILGADLTPAPWGYWPGRGFAYVPALEAYTKTRGFWLGHTKPEPGDIAIYNQHVGLVHQLTGPGRFTAAEGNEANQLQAAVPRTLADVVGFARIHR